MDPSMVDCRSLIDFCRTFEKHRAMAAANNNNSHHSSLSSRRRGKTLNPLSHPFCEHSAFAAIDAVILILVLGAAGVLALPYFRLIAHQASYYLFPAIIDLVGDALYHTPIAYGFGFVLAFAIGLAAYEFVSHQARKCGNPRCKGLKKAVEFDIQIESEECAAIRGFRFAIGGDDDDEDGLFFGPRNGPALKDRDELEAELKKMAPANGRTVLVFRAPCGCPAGRMEVWGHRKNRRTKR